MQTDCPLQVVTVLVAGGQIGSSRSQRSTEIVHEIIVFFCFLHDSSQGSEFANRGLIIIIDSRAGRVESAFFPYRV